MRPWLKFSGTPVISVCLSGVAKAGLGTRSGMREISRLTEVVGSRVASKPRS